MKYEEIFNNPNLAKTAVDIMWFLLMVHAFIQGRQQLSAAQCFEFVDKQRMNGKSIDMERFYHDMEATLDDALGRGLLGTAARVLAKLTGDPLDWVANSSGYLSSVWLSDKRTRLKRSQRQRPYPWKPFTANVAELLRAATLADREAAAEKYDMPKTWLQPPSDPQPGAGAAEHNPDE